MNRVQRVQFLIFIFLGKHMFLIRNVTQTTFAKKLVSYFQAFSLNSIVI